MSGSDPIPLPAEEMGHIPEEPLLPIEKGLIVWSLVLGVLLLALLAWVSHSFFEVPTKSTNETKLIDRFAQR